MPTLYENAYAVPKVLVADTLAGVRNIPSHTAADGALCYQRGGSAAFDQAGVWWNYDGDSTASDNGTSILKPSDLGASDPGRWRKP